MKEKVFFCWKIDNNSQIKNSSSHFKSGTFQFFFKIITGEIVKRNSSTNVTSQFYQNKKYSFFIQQLYNLKCKIFFSLQLTIKILSPLFLLCLLISMRRNETGILRIYVGVLNYSVVEIVSIRINFNWCIAFVRKYFFHRNITP